MRHSTIFTTGSIMTLVFLLVCCLKRPKIFINCHIPAIINMGGSIGPPNYIFLFWYIGSFLPIC